jgi:uncharacterized membrane protein
MNNDLIAMTFDTEQDAPIVRKSLMMMRNNPFLGAMNTVGVTRDQKENVTIHSQSQSMLTPPDPSCQLSNLIANAIFGKSPEQGIQNLIDVGLDEIFVKELASNLVPDSSLILNYVCRDSLVDTQQVIDAFSQFRGTVYHTTVLDEVEVGILEQNNL